MKKYLVIALVFMNIPTFAQWGDEEMDEKAAWKERIFTGGGLGASFGSNVDFISVSPLVGYKITPKLASGISFTYRYTNYKYINPKVSTSDYGISPFVRFNVYQNFFLHTEYEYLNYEFPVSAAESLRKDFSSFLAGGGFFQPIGRNAGFFALALYNFSYRSPSSNTDFQPYDSPLILRAGITAGF
jgi:hypothetical protein